MHRIILALLATGLSASPAIAGDYTDSVDKHSKCESAGKLAQVHHGITQKQFREVTTEIQRTEKSKKISKELSGSTQFLIWTGYSAKSSRDAYMQGWAWCMDQK